MTNGRPTKENGENLYRIIGKSVYNSGGLMGAAAAETDIGLWLPHYSCFVLLMDGSGVSAVLNN